MPALGALSGNQAMQMVRAGLKAVYCSGWQVGRAIWSTSFLVHLEQDKNAPARVFTRLAFKSTINQGLSAAQDSFEENLPCTIMYAACTSGSGQTENVFPYI